MDLREYFIGLDMGTDSVGWAVTTPDYQLVKRSGKALWGSGFLMQPRLPRSAAATVQHGGGLSAAGSACNGCRRFLPRKSGA